MARNDDVVFDLMIVALIVFGLLFLVVDSCKGADLRLVDVGGWQGAAGSKCYSTGGRIVCPTTPPPADRRSLSPPPGSRTGATITALVSVVFRPPITGTGLLTGTRGCGVLVAADLTRPGPPYLCLTVAHLQEGDYSPVVNFGGDNWGGYSAKVLATDGRWDVMALEVDGLPPTTLVLPIKTAAAVGDCLCWHALWPDDVNNMRGTVGLIGAGRLTYRKNGFLHFDSQVEHGISGAPVFAPELGLQGLVREGAVGDAIAVDLAAIRDFLDRSGIVLDGTTYTLRLTEEEPEGPLVPRPPGDVGSSPGGGLDIDIPVPPVPEAIIDPAPIGACDPTTCGRAGGPDLQQQVDDLRADLESLRSEGQNTPSITADQVNQVAAAITQTLLTNPAFIAAVGNKTKPPPPKPWTIVEVEMVETAGGWKEGEPLSRQVVKPGATVYLRTYPPRPVGPMVPVAKPDAAAVGRVKP